MFKKILIANRGEIALRVARACRELDIAVVAVYSSEDENSAVVSYADEAVRIGPTEVSKSYLNIAAVLEAAARTGADAIHPGYGFLSEDADFADACLANGVGFIGPSPEVIAALGNKTSARSLMADAGLPLLAGSTNPLRTVADGQQVADRIGYPVIIKAAAGGGGRGMRVVHQRTEFAAAYQETRARAQELFGDSTVFVEHYLEHGRHVEIQVLADEFGNAVHLGERDCSVQRRHQKLLEEAPAPGLPKDLVERMGQSALRGARAVGYQGAGTFEFLVNPDGAFFFIEVNCRIQVEHPVTEMITGVDLVHEQLRIASERELALRQEDVDPRGAAVECRINTEDPDRDFLPTPGILTEFVPSGGPFVRVDTHGFPGYRMPPCYDSLLAKVAVWAPSREKALNRMDRALQEFRIRGPGVHTTAAFLREVLRDPLFRRGEHNISVVDQVRRQVVRHDPALTGEVRAER